MRAFIARIWTAKASTFAGMLAAGLSVLLTTWANAPEEARIGVPIALAMLGAFSGGAPGSRKLP